MNMTKQIFVSFILLGILTGPLHVEAGGRVSLLKPRKSGTISRAEILRKRPNWILSEQISRRLSKRTRETYQQAKLAGFDVRLRLPIDRTRYALDHGFE